MRSKKDGEFVNAKVERALADRFNRYVERTRYPKTVVIEKALEEYLDRHEHEAGGDTE